jgi:hypothetical protein
MTGYRRQPAQGERLWTSMSEWKPRRRSCSWIWNFPVSLATHFHPPELASRTSEKIDKLKLKNPDKFEVNPVNDHAMTCEKL